MNFGQVESGLLGTSLLKAPAQDSIELSPKLGVSKSSNSGLKQRLPKWDVGESSSSELNQTLPNLRFRNSSNSALEQRLSKENFIERLSLRFDLLLAMSGFANSFNLGLEQKRPKWNLTESSARSSNSFKVSFVESETLFVQLGDSIKQFPS